MQKDQESRYRIASTTIANRPVAIYPNLETVDLPVALLGVGEGLLVLVGGGVPVLLAVLQPLSYAFPTSRFVPVWLL